MKAKTTVANAGNNEKKGSELGACPAADWTKSVDWEAYLTGGE